MFQQKMRFDCRNISAGGRLRKRNCHFDELEPQAIRDSQFIGLVGARRGKP
jgi:hypothetical protein